MPRRQESSTWNSTDLVERAEPETESLRVAAPWP